MQEDPTSHIGNGDASHYHEATNHYVLCKYTAIKIYYSKRLYALIASTTSVTARHHRILALYEPEPLGPPLEHNGIMACGRLTPLSCPSKKPNALERTHHAPGKRCMRW